MASFRLRTVLSSALATALASSIGIAACGGSTVTAPADGSVSGDSSVTLPDGATVLPDGATVLPDGSTVNFNGATCGLPGLVTALDKAKPAKPFDYVELRRTSVRFVDGGMEPDVSTAVASIGTKCKTATDKAACQDAINGAVSIQALFSEGGGKQVPSGLYLVVQSGDDAKTVGTREELLGFLGAIDSPEEARLLVAADGYEPLCSEGSVTQSPNGYLVIAKRNTECLNQYNGFVLNVTSAGVVTEVQKVDLTDKDAGCAVAGRRPEGYRGTPSVVREPDVLAYLAAMRSLEAASVPAFLRLADELKAHGAPIELIERAHEAARDEVRHTAGFATLRGFYGAAPCEDDDLVHPRHVRSLEDLAIENAVEGCVRETYGALVAGYQAEVAEDAPVRRLFTTVAEDEMRHAELAWDVAAWLEEKLDEAAASRVRDARSRAVRELATALANEAPSAELARRCGVPTSKAASVLLEGCRDLWAA